MTISEIIKVLEKAIKKYGDMEVSAVQDICEGTIPVADTMTVIEQDDGESVILDFAYGE